MITRAQFFTLTGLDTDSHASLKRRNQLPVINTSEREYTPFQALAFNLADRLAQSPDGHGMNRGLACSIVRDMLVPLIERSPDIKATAATFRLVDNFEKILAGRINVSGYNRPFVGTPAELADLIASEDVLDVILVNVTAAFVVLQVRAEREDIDLSGMWPDPHSFPTADEMRDTRRASWAQAVETVNAKRRGSPRKA
jgi:hypothetical protein